MKLEEILESKRANTPENRDMVSKAAQLSGHAFFALDGSVYVSNDDVSSLYVGRLDALMEDRSSMSRKAPDADPHVLGEMSLNSWVVDNIYANPDAMRSAVLKIGDEFKRDELRYKGERSPESRVEPTMMGFLSSIVDEPMGHGYTCFQLNLAGDQLVHHSDTQKWAGAIYLTPGAPPQSGVSFWRSRRAPRVRASSDLYDIVGAGVPTIVEAEGLVYGNALLDRTRWEEVDRVGNVYNRLVVWRADLIHSVSEVFGHNRETGRLVQLFFWDPV